MINTNSTSCDPKVQKPNIITKNKINESFQLTDSVIYIIVFYDDSVSPLAHMSCHHQWDEEVHRVWIKRNIEIGYLRIYWDRFRDNNLPSHDTEIKSLLAWTVYVILQKLLTSIKYFNMNFTMILCSTLHQIYSKEFLDKLGIKCGTI